jgi:hypothetical protein
MNRFYLKSVFIFIAALFFFSQNIYCQNIVISGKIIDANTKEPLKNVSVHLKGISSGTISKDDGSFILENPHGISTLELTSIGFNKLVFNLQKNKTTHLLLEMQIAEESLKTVIITSDKRDKEPGKRYMKKVIAHKIYNNPDRFRSYSYKQYLRHELDLSNLNTAKDYGKGLASLVINIYRNSDAENAASNRLPLYFSETISNKYHSLDPKVEEENIVAKKTLGLQTDKMLWHFDKFNFSFNIYDNWLKIFNQTYASPLCNTAFNYYDFYFDDSSLVNGKKVYKIHFTPKQKYENAFFGTLWINDSTYSIKKIEMHLSKSADLDFINDIHYSEGYHLVLDSATNKYEYMPYQYKSVVDFETGLALLGIPAKSNSKSVRLITINTTVIGNIKINSSLPEELAIKKMKSEQTDNLEKPESYWQQNRLDTLSEHEKSIYVMVDSLQNNHRFKRNSKIISLIGTGYWDFGNKIRIGPYSSFLSTNKIEGWRIRTGFWTLPGFDKKLNINGYAAYGTKDQKIQGGLGVKYLWNAAKWTKTSLFASSDYDYLIEQEDELDQDNLISSFFRKNIPTTRVYLKQILLKHEQYISKKLSSTGSLTYKELTPVFDFSYHPLNKITEQPMDSISARKLPVAEASVSLRYTGEERSIMFNYDRIYLYTYKPIFTANFIYGLEFGQAQFSYKKVNIGIEQRLRLPPKSLLYYKIKVGKTFGTLPYLLLNIPNGNEYYVASKYLFNTMLPYEYATDEYISLHTRLYVGGFIFDKIPFIRKLGWRQRFSFNAYQGNMSQANKDYNKSSVFSVPDSHPFMEAGVGIENIFHVFSIDYYKRLSGLNKNNVPKGGIFLGVNLTF